MSYYLSRDVIWIRPFGGRGIALKRTRLLFSERSGDTKYLRLPFGWRAIWLKHQQ
jgi:hypothetical protein